MTEREPEPDRHRSGLLFHQLAGGVVDRGNVINIEGMAHAEGVRGDAQPDSERLAAERQVLWGNQHEQQSKADHMKPHDDGDHPGDPAPFAGSQGIANLGK
jgi:hypothetical protein